MCDFCEPRLEPSSLIFLNIFISIQRYSWYSIPSMIVKTVAALFFLACLATPGTTYVCQHCDGNMCCNIPSYGRETEGWGRRVVESKPIIQGDEEFVARDR